MVKSDDLSMLATEECLHISHRMSVRRQRYPELEVQYELHETLGAGAVRLCSLASCHDLMIFRQVGLQKSRKVCTDSLERR